MQVLSDWFTVQVLSDCFTVLCLVRLVYSTSLVILVYSALSSKIGLQFRSSQIGLQCWFGQIGWLNIFNGLTINSWTLSGTQWYYIFMVIHSFASLLLRPGQEANSLTSFK